MMYVMLRTVRRAPRFKMKR